MKKKRKDPRVSASLQIKNNKYYVVTRIPDAHGKLHQKWIATGLAVAGNKRRAKQILDGKLLELQAEYERQNRRAGWAISDVGDVPFQEVVNRWMTRKRTELAPSTVEGYEHILARLQPYFLQLDLITKEVSPNVIEMYCKALLEDGLSANTVRHHLTLLKSVFNDEIKNGAPLLNPVKCIKPPKTETFEAKTYSIEYVKKLFLLFEQDEIEDIVKIAVVYGMRRSEICGLRWCDIDFEGDLIHVRHKISEVRVNGAHQIIKTNSLKTDASRRSFPLSTALKAKLLERKSLISILRKSENYCKDNLEYIFVHDDGRLITPNFVTDHFRYKIKASGLPPLRFHDLRHTCATLLLHEGCSLREIQAYLGHATYITTTRYAHVDGRSKQHALDTMDKVLTLKGEEKED